MEHKLSQSKIDELTSSLLMMTARPTSIQRENFYTAYLLHNPYIPVKAFLTLPLTQMEVEWYADALTYTGYLQGVADEYLHSGFFIKYLKWVESYSEEWLQICQKVKVAVENKDKTNIIHSLEEYYALINSSENIMYFTMAVWAFEQYTLPVMQDKLKKYFGNRYESAWEIITLQTVLIADQEHRIAIADIKAKFFKKELKEKEYLDNVVKINNKFRFVFKYNPESSGIISNNLIDKIEPEEAKDIPVLITSNKDKYEKLLSIIDDEDIREIVQFINYNIYFRTQRMEIVGKGFNLLSGLFDLIEKEWDFTRHEVGNVTNEEILNYFKQGVVPQRRTTRGAVIYYKNHVYFLDELQTKQIEKKLRIHQKTSELTGSVAAAGKVQGKIKIIIGIKDLIKVEKGDILVAQFTRPEYVPAMKLAAAIITNDGGITSHAAITARELKKPCIIGIKNATQVLKDGDLVEVDADEGVVKILEKSK